MREEKIEEVKLKITEELNMLTIRVRDYSNRKDYQLYMSDKKYYDLIVNIRKFKSDSTITKINLQDYVNSWSDTDYKELPELETITENVFVNYNEIQPTFRKCFIIRVLNDSKSISNLRFTKGFESSKLDKVISDDVKFGMYNCVVNNINIRTKIVKETVRYNIIFNEDWLCNNKINIDIAVNQIMLEVHEECLNINNYLSKDRKIECIEIEKYQIDNIIEATSIIRGCEISKLPLINSKEVVVYKSTFNS